MTAEDLDALAADVGSKRGHDGCDLECSGRKLVELARGYLSLRLVQADHERQIAALQAAYEDMQSAYLRVCGEPQTPSRGAVYTRAGWREGRDV